jgi:hypothetical protein
MVYHELTNAILYKCSIVNYVLFVLNKDIEEKAPLLQQQRKDYDAALITIDKLTLKLEDAMKVL